MYKLRKILEIFAKKACYKIWGFFCRKILCGEAIVVTNDIVHTKESGGERVRMEKCERKVL